MPPSILHIPFAKSTASRSRRPRHRGVFLAAVLLVIDPDPSALAAQTSNDDDERRAMTALPLRSGETIRLDGHIIEEAWSRRNNATPYGKPTTASCGSSIRSSTAEPGTSSAPTPTG